MEAASVGGFGGLGPPERFLRGVHRCGAEEGQPTHLHFHLARILQGAVGIPETGGMYRVAIEDISAWTIGDFSYSDD